MWILTMDWALPRPFWNGPAHRRIPSPPAKVVETSLYFLSLLLTIKKNKERIQSFQKIFPFINFLLFYFLNYIFYFCLFVGWWGDWPVAMAGVLRLVQSCKVRFDWGVARWREARTEQGRVETRSQTYRLTDTEWGQCWSFLFSPYSCFALQLQILILLDNLPNYRIKIPVHNFYLENSLYCLNVWLACSSYKDIVIISIIFILIIFLIFLANIL